MLIRLKNSKIQHIEWKMLRNEHKHSCPSTNVTKRRSMCLRSVSWYVQLVQRMWSMYLFPDVLQIPMPLVNNPTSKRTFFLKSLFYFSIFMLCFYSMKKKEKSNSCFRISEKTKLIAADCVLTQTTTYLQSSVTAERTDQPADTDLHAIEKKTRQS